MSWRKPAPARSSSLRPALLQPRRFSACAAKPAVPTPQSTATPARGGPLRLVAGSCDVISLPSDAGKPAIFLRNLSGRPVRVRRRHRGAALEPGAVDLLLRDTVELSSAGARSSHHVRLLDRVDPYRGKGPSRSLCTAYWYAISVALSSPTRGLVLYQSFRRLKEGYSSPLICQRQKKILR